MTVSHGQAIAGGGCNFHIAFDTDAVDLNTISVTVNGGPTASVVATQDSTASTLGGMFRLSLGAARTGYLPYDATADQMKATLSSLIFERH